MYSRSAHAKSRLGCRQCKKRRVKCSEQIPCQNCHRRGELCSLAPNRPAESWPPAAVPSPSQPPPQQAFRWSVDESHPLAFLTRQWPSALCAGPLATAPPITQDHVDDLFLMYHYTSSTYATTSKRSAISELWRTYVAEQAFVHPFLMHGILMFAAAHLRYLRPHEDQRFASLTRYHQERGLASFHYALMEINSENCGAVFAFASMLSIVSMTAITMPRKHHHSERGNNTNNRNNSNDNNEDEPPTTLADIDELMVITRGVRDVIEPAYPHMTSMPLRIMFGCYNLDDYNSVSLPTELASRVRSLSSMIHQFCSPANNPDAASACQAALADLERIYKDRLFLRENVDEIGVILKWIVIVPGAFLALVKAADTAALIVFAHYVMLLRLLHDRWYLQGMAERMMGAIERSIAPRGLVWLRWPQQQLNSDFPAFRIG